jgi:hypothetical protein
MFEGLSVLYFPVSCGLLLPADGVNVSLLNAEVLQLCR